MVMKVSEELS